MPRSGGVPGKLGNRYEGIWTVGQLLELLAGRLQQIVVEPFGKDALGIEFVTHSAKGEPAHHSVKRQRSAGEWTLAALCRQEPTGRSVLGDLFDKLRGDPSARCWFVSSTGGNHLRELTERARRKSTLEDFEKDLQGSGNLQSDFDKYLMQLAPDRETAFNWVQRTSVVLIDEAFLIRQVERHVDTLVYCPDEEEVVASDVRLRLADYVLDHLGPPITSEQVWDYLKSYGLAHRDWASDPVIREKLRVANESYVRNVEFELINGSRIERSQAHDVVRELQRDGGPRVVVVSAPAKYGKSCVLAQVLTRLTETSVPSLVVRLDRHGDAHNTAELGRQMDLPRSPAIVLAGVANGGPCVLLVDQLDAVSELSGRNPGLWEVFDRLREEATSYPNMRLVIACRSADLEHDHRLRLLTREEEGFLRVDLQLLSVQEVATALDTAEIEMGDLTTPQREILKTPLHLLLFLEGAGTDEAASVHHDSLFDAIWGVGALFDRFWERKQRAVTRSVTGQSHWTAVIDRLCRELSDRQTLAVPRMVLDEWPETADAMTSEHVLVREGHKVRFFHEAFFDYAFARRFHSQGRDLLRLLLDSEQHLFRRGQVRQILSYSREHDQARYLQQLKSVLTHGAVRFHIKRSVLQWLGSLPDPCEREWAVLRPLLEDPDLQRHVLVEIRNSLPWFDLLYRSEVVRSWLNDSDEQRVNWALWMLRFPDVSKERADCIAELLAPFRGRSEAWNGRLKGFFERHREYRGRGIQDLFLSLLDDGVVGATETHGGRSWWSLLTDAAKSEPEFVVEAIARWLDRRIALGAQEGREEILGRSSSDRSAEQVILAAADGEHVAFARNVLPRVLRIVEMTAVEKDDRLSVDRTWGSRFCGQTTGTRMAILEGLLTALRNLASTDPQVVEDLLDEHAETQFDTVAYLLLRTWSANPRPFGNRIVSFLLGDSNRLDVGYGAASDGDPYAAVSREAIAAAVPHLAADRSHRLEDAIIGHTVPWELVSPSHCGWTELLLLHAFGEAYLSEKGQQRWKELQARYPEIDTDLPSRRGGLLQRVDSPIPPDETADFTDDRWLEAMRERANGWEAPRFGATRGGAVELSRVLEQQVRLDRSRFTSLALRMEDGINPLYFSAILGGLRGRGNLSAEERAEDDELFRRFETDSLLSVVRRVHGLPGRSCGQSICDVFRRLADREIPESDLEILRYYALEDPDPSDNDQLERHEAGDQKDRDEAHSRGYNSVRGSAAGAIEALLFADYQRAGVLVPVLEEMVNDRSLAVRTCVFEALLPLLNHDRPKAVALFREACDGADAVLGCSPLEHFVHYVGSTHYGELRPVLMRALESSDDSAVVAAARQICLAAFGDEIAENDARQVRTGCPAMRAGAAEVYASNLPDAELRPICERHLAGLFQDQSEDVREKAAHCFQQLGDGDLDPYSDLIRKYIESPAFPAQHDGLLARLDQSTWQLPDVTLLLAERFIKTRGREAGDISTAAAGDAPTVAKLVVRLYSQTSDEPLKTRCLDLIDSMELLGFHGIDRELKEHDR